MNDGDLDDDFPPDIVVVVVVFDVDGGDDDYVVAVNDVYFVVVLVVHMSGKREIVAEPKGRAAVYMRVDTLTNAAVTR